MALQENSTHVTFIEQHRGFHGGSSSASTNQSNAFIHPSRDPARYFGENGLWDRGNDVNFLRNIIDPSLLSLGIGESVAGGSCRDPGHRDNPIIMKDDKEDEQDDAQQDGMFYDVDMSHEAFLALQELITTDVEEASSVANLQVHIPKASFTFPAKVWWVVTPAQLRPIATIKYVANPLYDLRAGPATPLEVSQHLSVEPMQVEGPGENTKRIAHAASGVQLNLSLYRSC
ncbi:hypothetical protein EJD97_003619 [Solanum chilense]|uniref:Uncharacterized protein n=1 Tax=Solanum chilense TaxID=4083 RepID=A0A6N2C0Q6_SOLCI|nr:hypothetical protein EJD97_003619 [Solanum chilense]